MMKTSLIITTYNWTSALSLVLSTVASQLKAPDEVIIADDGSREMTRELIVDWVSRLGCPIIHVWQSDRSFRASRARNLAALKASGDHLIFIDGDCLMPPQFIQNHRKIIDARTLVSGGRLLLSREQSTEILSNPQKVSVSQAFSGMKHVDLSWLPFRKLFPLSWKAVRTCNLAVLKADFLAVCGFDEDFIGWGKEDSDLAVRLTKNSCKLITSRYAACVSHLFHDEQSRKNLDVNEAALQVVRCSPSTMPRKSCLETLK